MLEKSNDILIVQYILKNIRDEDKQELIAIFDSDWYQKTIDSFYNKEFLVLYGYDEKKHKVPIAIGGIDKIDYDILRIGSVWLLSSVLIYNNRKLLFSILKNQILSAEKDFDILFNFIYKSNFKLKIWLKKIGFEFDSPFFLDFSRKDGFELFYKIIERSS